MRQIAWRGGAAFVCMGILALAWGVQTASAEVTADPAIVTITSPQQSVSIRLTQDGAPIPAAEIRGWQFLASEHDYKSMLTCEKMDGALKIASSGSLEVGSYDLLIDTSGGPATVRVYAPLSDLPDVIQKQAAILGVSEEVVKQRMGLSSTLRERIAIELPPVYYEGQTFSMTLPSQPGRICTWIVNSDIVRDGVDQNSLSYTFKKPGEYVFNYIETTTQDGKMITLARGKATTRVVALPPIPVNAVVNVPIAYSAPPGGRKIAWRVDGQDAGASEKLVHAFATPGVHTVDCVASSPLSDAPDSFQHIQYKTTVTAQ